jgi:hypothetical protein
LHGSQVTNRKQSGKTSGANREALSLYRETIRLKPDFWIGYNNIMNALSGLGDEEGVVREVYSFATFLSEP